MSNTIFLKTWVDFEAIIALYNILNFIPWCVYLNGIFHKDAMFPCVCMLNRFHGVWLFATPWTVACQDALSVGFSRQEHWSGLPFPSPGDLPNPGIEPRSPALQADALTSEPPGKPERKNKAYSTRYSQAVSHPSTNQAWPCLASKIRGDRAR